MHEGERMKKNLISGLVLSLGFAAIFTFSTTAHAGLVSFLENLAGSQSVSAKTPSAGIFADSQTSSAIVLQAANGVLTAGVADAEIPPLDGETTLSADMARANATSTEILNPQISVYVVRTGDSVSGVAKMFNVSVNTILWANDLTSKSTLKVGQSLVILPVTGLTYTVKSKDTIQTIAKKYGAAIDDILNYNDLTLASTLKVGQEIIIPDAEVPVRAPVAVVPKKIVVGDEPLLDGWGWPSYPGYYACPLPGARLSQGLHGHNGVDLAAPKGTPIRAASDGTVIINRSNGAYNGGYGNFVVVLHANGTQTLYSHMSKSVVVNGQHISALQTVGYVGMTGLTTGPHLHFEVRGAANPFADPSLCR